MNIRTTTSIEHIGISIKDAYNNIYKKTRTRILQNLTTIFLYLITLVKKWVYYNILDYGSLKGVADMILI